MLKWFVLVYGFVLLTYKVGKLDVVSFCLKCSVSGSVYVSSCRCCVLVSLMHHVAFFNPAFCTICNFGMFVSDARGDHELGAYSFCLEGLSLLRGSLSACSIPLCIMLL